MNETTEQNELELVERIAREAKACAGAFAGRRRAPRSADLDLTISTLAKQLSKRAAGGVEDRKSRQLARTDAYNAVRPVLEAMADHHRRLTTRSRWLALGAAGTSAAIVAFVAFRLS
jgi:hypothetical protein